MTLNHIEMKNKSIIYIVFLWVALAACRDEDLIRDPAWVTPVIPTAVILDGTAAKANVEDPFILSDLDNSVYDFILDIEDYDGAEDGHMFYVGREGPISSLVDFTMYIDFSGDDADRVVFGEYMPEDFPMTINITPEDAVGYFAGLEVSDLVAGNEFELSYEYRIDADNTGVIRSIGLPASDWCGGFSDEGEFCTLTIGVVE